MMALAGALAAAVLLAGPPPGEAKYEEGRAFLRQKPRFSLVDAAAAFSAGCDAGHIHACSALALQVQDGRGVARDPARAAQMNRKVCDAGWGIGCFNLALQTMNGTGVDPDPKKGMALFKEAEPLYAKQCAAGDLQWCTNLGVLYEGPFLGAPEPAKAAAIYKAACDKKAGDWCVNYALQQALGDGGVKRDPRAAETLLDKVCKANVPLACGTLGQMYVKKDYGLPPEPKKAVPLLVRACEGGESQGCQVLSALYALGEQVAADPVLSRRYGERACALGASASCYAIGVSILQGQKFADAYGWFVKSCHIGEPQACAIAYAMHAEGKVPKNDALGAAFLSDACRLGDPGSCVEMLKQGQKLPLHPDHSKGFLEEACRRGIPGTCR